MKKDQVVIIMDGPDFCGKTQIGKALSHTFNAPYFKVSSEKKNWQDNTFINALRYDQTYISEFLEQTGLSCTIDRAWISEAVYSHVYNRETDWDVITEVDERFKKIGAIVIICRRRNYDDFTDELVSKEYIKAIDKEYGKVCQWSECDIIELFVDDFDCDLKKEIPYIINEITKIIEARNLE